MYHFEKRLHAQFIQVSQNSININKTCNNFTCRLNNEYIYIYIYCNSDKCPRWSSGCDARPNSKRLELDPPLRHIIVSRLCYLSFGGDVISELEIHEDMLSAWRDKCDSPWWSSGYAAVPDNERLGFDPPLRHRIFSNHVTFSTHCYIILNFSSMTSPLRIADQRTDHLHR